MPHGYNGKILHMHRSRSTWRAKVPYTGVVSDLRAGPLSTLPPPRDPSYLDGAERRIALYSSRRPL